MTNENNSIHRVKINITTNQKKVNLETLLRKLFVNKIQPYIIKKIDGIDIKFIVCLSLFPYGESTL